MSFICISNCILPSGTKPELASISVIYHAFVKSQEYVIDSLVPVLDYILLHLSIGLKYHLVQVIRQNSCTTPLSHLPPVVQLFAVGGGALLLS